MNGDQIVTDRFSNPESEKIYHTFWNGKPSEARDLYEAGRQCGGCGFFTPFNLDWGLCSHHESRHYLETVFEHFTCLHHVNEGWGPHSFTDFNKYPELRRYSVQFELDEHIYDAIKRQADRVSPDQYEDEMYRLVMGALEKAFIERK